MCLHREGHHVAPVSHARTPCDLLLITGYDRYSYNKDGYDRHGYDKYGE